MKIILSIILVLCPGLMSSQLSAQQPKLDEIQGNITIFTGVLENALGLNLKTGLFGTSAGSIKANYLYHQGIYIEIRTPLSMHGRNQIQLNFSDRRRIIRLEPQSPFSAARAMTLSSRQAADNVSDQTQMTDSYRQFRVKIAQLDISQLIQNFLRDANSSARSLRGLGALENEAFSQALAEMSEIQEQTSQKMTELQSLEAELEARDSADPSEPDSETTSRWENTLTQMSEAMEPLTVRARQLAERLKLENEVARQKYESRWQQDVLEFDELLFTIVCDYGATLKSLGDNEFLTIALNNMGSQSAEDESRDKIHVFAKPDLINCQRGTIDATQLRELASSYSF